jgi:hypothetical protein
MFSDFYYNEDEIMKQRKEKEEKEKKKIRRINGK